MNVYRNGFFALVLVYLLSPAVVSAAVCNVDADSDVDINDIRLIIAARNTPVFDPDDPRDANGDGLINILDARACVFQCTLPRCAEIAANNPPTITSTPVTTATEGLLYTYDADASDPDAGDTLVFSLELAPAGMTIDPVLGLIEWIPGAAQIGSQDVRVNVRDPGGLADTQSFAIDVTVRPADDFERPAVTLSVAPPVAQFGDSVTISVTATDDTAVVSTSVLVNGDPVSLDGQGIATYLAPAAGIYNAVATARDAAGNEGGASLEFRLVVPGDTQPPTVSLAAPADLSEISSVTDIIGTVIDDGELARYLLEYSLSGRNEFIRFGSDTAPVLNGQLGQLDPALLRNGIYDIRLTAEDLSGNFSRTTRQVLVTGDDKPGNFIVGFTDLSIPGSLLPIAIERGYDSRRRNHRGDFGFGWSLEGSARGEYQNNRPPGDGWVITPGGGFLNPPCTNSIDTEDHVTEIHFSDTEYYRFEFRVDMYGFGSAIGGGCLGDGRFIQTGGIPGATLKIIGSREVFWQNGSDEVISWPPIDFNTYEPEEVRLTAADGWQYDLNINGGLRRIADPSGNSLFFSSNGVVSSSGEQVEFARDAQGRITSITDPLGNAIRYDYDFYGDLVGVTEPNGEVTRFRYNVKHNLLDIIGP